MLVENPYPLASSPRVDNPIFHIPVIPLQSKIGQVPTTLGEAPASKEEEDEFVKQLSARKKSDLQPRSAQRDAALSEGLLNTLTPRGTSLHHNNHAQQMPSMDSGNIPTSVSKVYSSAPQTSPHTSSSSSPNRSSKNDDDTLFKGKTKLNLSGLKLSKITTTYQNYSKPIEVTSHVSDPNSITEKRLKKIRTQQTPQSKEMINIDTLFREEDHSPTFSNSSFSPNSSSLLNSLTSIQSLKQSMTESFDGSSLVYSTSPLSPARCCSPTISPTGTSGRPWSKLTGGFYNSPKCFNVNHRDPNDPNFIRKSALETSPHKKIVIQSEKDPPHVRVSKEAIKELHKKHCHIPLFSTSPPRTTMEEQELQDNTSFFLSSRSVITLTPPPKKQRGSKPVTSKEKTIHDLAQYERKRREEFENPYTKHSRAVFAPTLKPKHQSKKKSPEQAEDFPDKKERKIRSNEKDLLNYHEFDRNRMAFDPKDTKLDQLLDPKNYPLDLQHQVEFFGRKNNMSNNDYKNFISQRAQKQYTPYLYYRRGTIRKYMEFKQILKNTYGEVPELPHQYLFVNDENIVKSEDSQFVPGTPPLNSSLPNIHSPKGEGDPRVNSSDILN